jgi:hypothetical protein
MNVNTTVKRQETIVRVEIVMNEDEANRILNNIKDIDDDEGGETGACKELHILCDSIKKNLTLNAFKDLNKRVAIPSEESSL